MKLEDVVAAEREIAQLVDAERLKADEWLEATTRTIDATTAAERARLNELAAKNEAAAKKNAAAKAATIVDQAKALAARIAALDDERLRPIVRKHLARILPGAIS